MRHLHLLFLLLMSALFACGSQSCDCGGSMGPIPDGYPMDSRAENALQLRIGEAALKFIEENQKLLLDPALPGGELTIPIDQIRQKVDAGLFDIQITICRGGGCEIKATVESLRLVPVENNAIDAMLRMKIRGVGQDGGDSWKGSCDIRIDTNRGSRDYIELALRLRFNAETEAARLNYTRIDGEEVRWIADLQKDDLAVNGNVGCDIANSLARSYIVDTISDSVQDLANETLTKELCQTRGDFGCPANTFAVPNENPDSVCRFTAAASGKCVAPLIGTEQQGDLEVGSDGPTPVQLLVAAGGDGESINGGLSLFMYGSMRSMSPDFTKSPMNNDCVPIVEPPAPRDLPRLQAFRENQLPGSDTVAHLGFGVSEHYLNQIGYSIFDAGGLCSDVPPNAQFTSKTLASLAPSLQQAFWPEKDSPVTVRVRPQQPLSFEIGQGDEPLLTANLPQLDIDFYTWAEERWIRAFTFRADLGFEIDLTVEGQSIRPSIRDVKIENAEVLNAKIVSDDKESVANVFKIIVEQLVGPALDGLMPFELPDTNGLRLIPVDGGFIGIEEGGEEFLGIFLNLEVAESMALTPPMAANTPNANPSDGMSQDETQFAAAPLALGSTFPPNGSWPLAFIALMSLLGLAVWRRKREWSFGMLFSIMLMLSACSSDKTDPTRVAGKCDPNPCSDGLCCPADGSCVDSSTLCPDSECVADTEKLDENCVATCECAAPTSLPIGKVGSYLSAAEDESGSTGLAAYAAGRSADLHYGDLVFARFVDGELNWQFVDGVPDAEPSANENGFRGGISESGDDVGRGISMIRHGDGFAIAYFDKTNGDLKIAVGKDDSWTISTLDSSGIAGQSPTLFGDGAGSIYLVHAAIVPATSTGEKNTGAIRLLKADANADLTLVDSWSREEFANGDIPCRPTSCGESLLCGASGACLLPEPSTCTNCSGICSAGACEAPFDIDTVERRMPFIGDQLEATMTDSGIAIAYHNGVSGELLVARKVDGKWTSLAIASPGEVGRGLSMTSSGNEIHVTFVDENMRALRHARISAANEISLSTIDDGRTMAGGERHPDQRHTVGDDASILVLNDGKLRVAYQDTTDLSVWVAEREGESAWTKKKIATDYASGFWLNHRKTDSSSEIITQFWNIGGKMPYGIEILSAD